MLKKITTQDVDVNRRQFVTGTIAGASLLSLGIKPSFADIAAINQSSNNASFHRPDEITGNIFNLNIDYQKVNFTGRKRIGNSVNGSIPAPTLRFKEGEDITLHVNNKLTDSSSIHWHGLILPNEMDGVPGLTFDGIPSNKSYTYQFKAVQNGTYWYHSHSKFQEQQGVYGAIIIDPKEPEPFTYDKDYVIVLSDWTDEDPNKVLSNLKKMPHYYNTKERTIFDTINDIKEKGIVYTLKDRSMWNNMRMSDTDLSDVTGKTYTFLMNGNTPEKNWQGLFNKGETIRLRFINAAAMTIFDVRIPGLKMSVVAADGQYIQPVPIDEFRIANAETYDVLITPDSDKAYTIFAQTIDRSGFARGTITPDYNLSASVPEMDERVSLTHQDMGMDMSAMDHGSMDMSAMDHSQMMASAKTNDGDIDSNLPTKINSANPFINASGEGSNAAITHGKAEFGPHVDMRANGATSGIDDPGVGLRNSKRKVLRYSDLKNLYPTKDTRDPSREVQIHLTGSMSRYMWSFDGVPFSDASPIELKYGERVRFTLINDTMMTHPIHLHGVWSELETGDAEYLPKKHTIIVQPGRKVSYLVTADAYGNWAFHCHLSLHMTTGMFRNVKIS